VGLFARRTALPEDVREQVPLAAGERLLVWAPAGSGWAVATTHALWLPSRTGHERLGWEVVDSAAWSAEEGVLAVVQAAPLGGRPRRWTVRVEDARDLLLVVKERVRATVVLSRQVPLAGGRGVTIVGRRRPGSDRLAWSVSVGEGVDLGDEAVRAQVEQALRSVRSEVGG
jgi:hypothetical protein